MESLCYVCRSVITSDDLIVCCDYCSWVKHRKCSGLSLEDYYRKFRSRVGLTNVCESCEHDFGEEVRELNQGALGVKRLKDAVKSGKIPESALSLIEEEGASSSVKEQTFDLESSFLRDIVEEISIADIPVDPEKLRKLQKQESPVKYTIVENGTRRGNKVLMASDGHSYTLGKVTSRTTNWRCRSRNTFFGIFAPSYCGATVKQRGNTFTRGYIPHEHFARENFGKKTKKNKKIQEDESSDSDFSFDLPRNTGKSTEKRQAKDMGVTTLLDSQRPFAAMSVDSLPEISTTVPETPAELVVPISQKGVETSIVASPTDTAMVEEDSPTMCAMKLNDGSAQAVVKDTEESIEFTIIENGSKRGTRKLVSSDGFAYTIQRSTSKGTSWRCTTRNKSMSCRATVIQRGDTFVRGCNLHCHGGNPGIITKTKVQAEVRTRAKSILTNSARQLVKSVLDEHRDQGSFKFLDSNNLIRAANRKQQQLKKQKKTTHT